jgi:outer membrane protein assembly factor BamB
VATPGKAKRIKGSYYSILLIVVIIPLAGGGAYLLDRYRSYVPGGGGSAYFGQPEVEREEVDAALLDKLKQATLPAEESSASSSSDWPQWRGPTRTGRSQETDLLENWPEEGPAIVWRAPSGEGYSSLAVANGKAYTVVQLGEEETVLCWEADTGKEVWRFGYTGRFSNMPGPRSTPSVDKDRVYTVGATGLFHCLNTANGKVMWKHDLLKEYQAPLPSYGVSFSPLVEGDLVLTNPGGPQGCCLVAFDKNTGKEKWKSFDDLAGYSSPLICTLAGRRQAVFFTGKNVVGVGLEDGKVLWQFTWETNFNCNAATPIVLGNYVFISTNYGKGCALIEVTAGAGDKLLANSVYQHNRMRNHFSSCVLHGEHLYGFDDNLLVCMEFRTGKIKWKERGFDKGSLLIANHDLIILGEHGQLVLAEASPQSFRAKSKFQVSLQKCWSAPALANGRLYVRDEKEVVCLDLRKK